MFSSCLVLPLLLTVVEGLETVSLDNIAARIVQATHKLHVNGFMGFGVGAGVNILLRVVNQEPRLLNGSLVPTGWGWCWRCV